MNVGHFSVHSGLEVLDTDLGPCLRVVWLF